MKARDLMSKNPSCVTPEMSIRDAARLMKTEDVGVLPVVESEGSKRVVGLVTDRDIAVRAVAEGRAEASVRDVMTADPRTAREDDDVDNVMSLMGQEQVRRIPIVDERGQLVGIVAQADIVRQASDRKAERTVEKISEPGGKHTS
ncbi:MAG: CBS domain-containing protein [Gemmatimonadaceae bacterium]